MTKLSVWMFAINFCLQVGLLYSQDPFGQRPPEFNSAEIAADGRVTFRIHAPNAKSVRLSGSDFPGVPQQGIEFTKAEESGVWECVTPQLPGGAYRYRFNVDGVAVVDPKSGSTSESNGNTWSLLTVPGSAYSDLRDVPHGAVARIDYHSASLNRFRRLHVYTPSGYESGKEKYPVLYLLHGAFDCDNSWSTVGQANQILDNLIAEGRAKPMIVVMPAGHTGTFAFGPSNNFQQQMTEFVKDFQESVRPLIESRYRTIEDASHRAIAGLSMGGAQTIDIALSHLDHYGYVGVFSSGVFGIDRGGPEGDAQRAWENRFSNALDDPELKKGLKLIWFATGRDDFLIGTTRASVDAFKSHGFQVTFHETDGGHTWNKWRDYLHEFAPLLFQ